MKKTLKIFLLIVLALIIVIGTALGVGLYNPRAYENVINKLIYKKTGYQYSTSELSIQLSPTTIFIEDLKLSNPDWSDGPVLLELGSAVVSLDIKQLFNKKFPFWNAVLRKVDVKLAENENGQINWNTPILANQASVPGQEDKSLLDYKSLLSFSNINIEQAKLRQIKPDITEEVDISSLSIKRTSDVSVELQGAGMYQEQSVDIAGSIEIDNQNSAEQLLHFAMQAQGLGIDLQSKGEVNPLNLDGAAISLKAKSDNLEKLEAFLKTTFPAVTPIDVTLDLLSSNGSYEVSKINLQMGGNTLTGDVLFEAKDSFLRVNLASEKINLTPFVSVKTNQEVRAVTAEEATEEEIDWAWMEEINSEINLEVGEILADEHTIKDLSAALKIKESILDVEHISARYQLQSVKNPEKSFVSDLIKISGTAKPLAKKTQGNDMSIDVSIVEHNSSLALEGDVNINGIEGSLLEVNADVRKLDYLANYLQTDFSPYLPASISAKYSAAKSSINLEKLKLKSKESDVSGSVKANWSNEIVNVEGKLQSNLLDLSPMMIEAGADSVQKKNSKEEKIFSDEAIDWGWLDTYGANFDLAIGKLIVKENIFTKVNTKLAIGNGSLSIKPLQAQFADGGIKSAVTLNTFSDGVKFDIQLDAINLGLAAMGATGDSVLEGGTTDVVLGFSGQGKSLHQIMSSLDGEIIAEVQKGIIKNDAFEAIGTDIVLEMLTMLNPFMKEDETTELECAAVKFTAEEGVFTSNNQLAVETSKMKIVGSGIIDMSTEELEIGFSPSAKKGIGVNVGSLVKFVRLGGTLSNPRPEADPVGLLKSGAAIGAAVSTGGLSLLVEGLFKRVTSTGSACNQALKNNIDDENTELEVEQSQRSKQSEEAK